MSASSQNTVIVAIFRHLFTYWRQQKRSPLIRRISKIIETRYEKTGFLHMRKQRRRSVTAKLISAFVFAARIVQSLYFLNPKFQASSHLLWLYSPACVGPGRKPRRPVFSQRGSINCYSFWNLPYLLMTFTQSKIHTSHHQTVLRTVMGRSTQVRFMNIV